MFSLLGCFNSSCSVEIKRNGVVTIVDITVGEGDITVPVIGDWGWRGYCLVHEWQDVVGIAETIIDIG